MHPTASSPDIEPRGFSDTLSSTSHDVYLSDPATSKLAEFFRQKGLAALKEEDQREQWYEDWLAYQARHQIYATVLSSSRHSTRGGKFDVLRWARFLEVFGYFSPAHGYSAQVTFLGLFAVLMGSNDGMKHEATRELEQGGLLAFGVSEKAHGSDLLGGDFNITELSPGRYIANGTKYYIGNANAASIIAILAKREPSSAQHKGDRADRVPFVLFSFRPRDSNSFRNLQKIRTLGVRGAYVGAFEVKDHELADSDIIAQGRQAWDAILGTVTLGKFFLGFGSIGICEHAFEEARDHLSKHILYGKPAIEMPHLRHAMTQAYVRIAAMKLYAFRALDYVQTASPKDRRYLLLCAVQKARVSTEGVKVMHLLLECMGARGLEADTYFEMALRDILLFPGLESSAHINLALTAQFCARYFDRTEPAMGEPESLIATKGTATENDFLLQARSGSIHSIAFAPTLRAYAPFKTIPNVRRFVRQIKRFRGFLRDDPSRRDLTDLQRALAIGQCLAVIVYGQLIAQNARLLDVPAEMVSAIFHTLVADLAAAALVLASLPQMDRDGGNVLRKMAIAPQTTQADWDLIWTKAR